MDKVAIFHQFLNVCIWGLKIAVFPQVFDFHATLASELSKSQFYTSFWRLALISCEGAAPGLTKFAICHMFGCPTCAISAEGCPCPKEIHIPRAPETHDLHRRLLRHMFAHLTHAISAESCPRTKKTRISPHVWVSDTLQTGTSCKPPPGCPCRQKKKKNWSSLILQGFRYNLITWKLAELTVTTERTPCCLLLLRLARWHHRTSAPNASTHQQPHHWRDTICKTPYT